MKEPDNCLMNAVLLVAFVALIGVVGAILIEYIL